MDEPAPKRRRTSPRGDAAPVRDAPSHAETPQSTRSRGDRPSFASPTKASLARHNPQILERRRSVSASPNKLEASGPTARRANVQAAERTTSRALPSTAENVAASEPQGDEDDDEDEFSREEGSQPSSGQSTRKPRGSLGAEPRRPLTKPNPRPLPPPGPEGEDELSPFVDRDLHRSQKTGVPISRPEPELPLSVSDQISSTPPRGIHSSPSRWRGKGKVKKSSPLKPRPEVPGKEPPRKPTSFLRRLQDLQVAGSAAEQDPFLDELSNPARMVPAFDLEADKKKERDVLKEEISALTKDLEAVRRENERIRVMQASGRTIAPADEDAVLDIVRRHLMPKDLNARAEQSHQLMKAALNPMALLPFGRLIRPSAAPEQPDELAPIKSHHPVVMTAEEELPYLQLFSPFDISSEISMLREESNQQLRQQHSINIRSRDSPAIFHAKIEIIVDALELNILELSVPKIHPAAKPELRPFIEKICEKDCNRSMQRNVGILSWAMGEWHRVSSLRASLWAQLDEETASKNGILQSVVTLRETRGTQPPDADEDDIEGRRWDKIPRKRPDVLRFLGQQWFDIAIPSLPGADAACTLRLEWKIGFDWTGEAQNDLSVKLNAPAKCEFHAAS